MLVLRWDRANEEGRVGKYARWRFEAGAVVEQRARVGRREGGASLRSEYFEVGGAGACDLCGRSVRELTRHHLIPRARHKKKRARKKFHRREMENRITLLCRPCHRNVHASIDNKELEREYNTLEALAAHPGVRRFTRWIKNKPHGTAVAPGACETFEAKDELARRMG